MHRAPAAVETVDFLFPQSSSHFYCEAPSYSPSEKPRSSLDPGHRPYAIGHSDSQDNSLTLKNLQRLPITTGLSRVFLRYTEAPVRDGLRTPPEDDMNTTTSYQTQQFPIYRPQDSSCSFASSHTVSNSVPSISTKNQVRPYNREEDQSSQQSKALVAAEALSNIPQLSSHARQIAQSPKHASTSSQKDDGRGKSAVLPSLQIPSSINSSGGSLGEFAAQITCLFWFESTPTLQLAEDWVNMDPNTPVKRLVPDAIPTVGFRKWVVTILSTTQVTPNVILLALLFIYRLKTLNAKVKGKLGSEYRLLTVALMLGNKFLDDNTYTNKTWAEVSGISVNEIHVMEVEFLSNMRYSLFASKDQWAEWQLKLSKFSEYFDKASKAPATLPSPVGQILPSVLPSPPSSMQSSPPALSTYPQSSTPYNYSQTWSTGYAPPLLSPLGPIQDTIPDLTLQPTARKRSYDDDAEEPPAKRVTRSATAQATSNSIPPQRQNVPRLPLPNLSVSTQMNGYPANFQQNMTLLPPLGGRSMSTVYPTTPSYTPQSQAALTPNITAGHSSSNSLGGMNYGTPSRRHSPRSVQDLLSMNSSPISGTFPNNNSPSFFLQQRSSPYRPVRPPNTLLYPPPSASMNNFRFNVEQMHYQPLGKRNDYRPGLVPEYVAHPNYQNWPSLRQPNFQT